jgi:hypothetical protein
MRLLQMGSYIKNSTDYHELDGASFLCGSVAASEVRLIARSALDLLSS